MAVPRPTHFYRLSPPAVPINQPSAASEKIPNGDTAESGGTRFRALAETLAGLAMSVVLFRAFEVEGYMISTGSMAPTLYGYHKRVECPSCGRYFAVGVSIDENSPTGPAMGSDDSDASDSDSSYEGVIRLSDRDRADCPNCGQRHINAGIVPRNHGDQLLVLKNAYDFRHPARWEVVVFRNPGDPQQAYVKRVVGLPGESVQVRDGDVYVEGKLCRKSLESQRGMRINVHDTSFLPLGDPDFQSRWTASRGSGWSPAEGGGYRFELAKLDAESNGEPTYHWMRYRHRIRAGGMHRTSATIPKSAGPIEPVISGPLMPFDWSPSKRTLTVTGVLSADWAERIKLWNGSPIFHATVDELRRKSHEAPITDAYAYNHDPAGVGVRDVRDLMLVADVTLSPKAEIAFEIADGREHFRVLIDAGDGRMQLVSTERPGEILRETTLRPDDLTGPISVELSVIDRQVLVALDGQLALEPLTYASSEEYEPGPSPVRIGVRRGEVTIDRLRLFRDVHYTAGRARNGIDEPYQLGDDEYFVLGDNSPVSLDSRAWPEGAVAGDLLIGKPFVVHLPSRPGTLNFGNRTLDVRIPDFSRVRFVR
ncbi:signal peptidase I [Stratiformator vulcanicus]|uniref:Signal peptidase I n=1 Tax=Stratiformator vulcanicus TaxID=2527980 RepID=A0A517QW46_9PLAN|nr:signal peptidase I [Stratiformator vulcanicus]QDT35886.1 Signal peptidase I V [Stratiformator vulcanicus]